MLALRRDLARWLTAVAMISVCLLGGAFVADSLCAEPTSPAQTSMRLRPVVVKDSEYRVELKEGR